MVISTEGMAAWASWPLLISAAKARVSDTFSAYERTSTALTCFLLSGIRLVLVVMLFRFCFALGLGFRIALGLGLAGVPADAVKALDVDEQGVVVGRAGGLQDADDREGPVRVVALPAGFMGGPELVAAV